MSNYYDILTVRYLLGIITDEERSRLEAWRRQDAANEALFQKMVAQEITQEEYARYASIDAERAWDKFVKQTGIDDTNIKGKHVISFRHLWRYAAAVLVLVAVGAAGWWYTDYKKVTPPVLSQEVEQAMHQSMMSGKQEAKIEKFSELAVADKQQVAAIQEELEQYAIEEDVVEELLAAKRVTTLHDKEFWVTLDDKTVVHLNYNSKLIYPEKFQGGSRDVILEGEAYFMVAKDKSRPFVVHTPNGDVTVYGTEFNVNTRVENGNANGNGKVNGNLTAVVLVNGSVSVKPVEGMEKMLQPGEMAVLSSSERRATITQVDTEPYVAWNTGLFMFDDVELGKVMDVLSRWYQMKVVFEDDNLKDIKLYSNFDKYGDIEPILKGISMVTGLDIQIHKDIITVKR